MGETSDGPPAAGQRVSDDGDPDSPARSTFFSRLFRREAPESGHSEQEPGDSDASRAASSDGEIMVNLRNLRRMRVDDVSVPRADIVAVSEDSTIEDLVSVFQNSTLSRLPVYAEAIDRAERPGPGADRHGSSPTTVAGARLPSKFSNASRSR